MPVSFRTSSRVSGISTLIKDVSVQRVFRRLHYLKYPYEFFCDSVTIILALIIIINLSVVSTSLLTGHQGRQPPLQENLIQ